MTEGIVVIFEIVKIEIEYDVGAARILRIEYLSLFAQTCTVCNTRQVVGDS